MKLSKPQGAKLSKSKTPKFEVRDGEGCEMELEPYSGDGGAFVLSIRNEDENIWRCVDVTVEQLEEMAAWARRHRRHAADTVPSLPVDKP